MQSYWREKKFWHAVAVLVGTMVGVGIYGIPFVFAKTGFWVGTAWLVGLTLAVGLFNLLFAELTLVTQGTHELVGYANIWLGGWGRRLMTLFTVLGGYGALLAYVIVVGEFIHNILSQYVGVDPQLYSILFAVGWSLFWFARLKTVAAVELVLAGLYITTVALLGVFSAPHIAFSNLGGWTPEFWYLPYGVVLFALSGLTAIPLQRRLLTGREQQMMPAIITAMAIVALLYFAFAFIIVGISGDITSPDAISGLFDILRTPAVVIGSILGILTISTSYLMMGTALFDTFRTDYRLRAGFAWLLTGVPPVLFFLSGLRNFIDVIGLVGAVAVGAEGVLLLIAYLRARRIHLRHPEFRIRVPVIAAWLLMLLFTVGGLYEIFMR